ncbi:hypothetical protein T07_11395, partial [Trichinella nelsoni]
LRFNAFKIVHRSKVVPIHSTSTSVLNISLFLSTDTDLINLIRFLWFLFSHTVSKLYTGIKQDPSSRGLLGSSKKYTIVFVYVIPYANSRFKRTYNYTFVSVHGNCIDSNNRNQSTTIGGIKSLLTS